MPTGYTHKVQDGSVTTLREFAMICARAFGACVTMRDDALDAEIPEAFEPSDYHARSLADAEAALAAHLALTPQERIDECRREYDADCAAWNERRQRREVQRQRYEAMVAQVEAWAPPTSDHVEFRKFMLDQLRESIRFDCSGSYDTAPKRQEPTEWWAETERTLRQRVEYSRDELRKERERTDGRNGWLKALRASLPSA